jgi:tRNA threonylcarbamoyladenosine biosynthesis protein TsaB
VVDALGARPEDLARLTAALDPATNPPKPLYLRAPDATPPTRLAGQPRSTVPA